MYKNRWLFIACCGLAISIAAVPGFAADAPALTSRAKLPAYPQCPSIHEQVERGTRCIDLFESLNPAEFSVKDFKATTLALRDREHAVTAYTVSGSDSWLANLALSPSGVLYAIGGPDLLVASSSDDGHTWRMATHVEGSDTLQGLAFVNTDLAYAVGTNGRILRTQNAGGAWEGFNQILTYAGDKLDAAQKSVYSDLNYDGSAYDVAFADAEHGIVVGEARLLYTHDGGQQWQRIRLDDDNVALQRVQFVDATKGWVVGTNGTVLHTLDAGEHWRKVDLGDDRVHLMGLSFVNDRHGCVGGDFKVWCTWDGGEHWQAATMNLPKGFDASADIGISRLRLRDDKQGWLVTSDGWIFVSGDGGRQWRPWMNVAAAGKNNLDGIQLWGLVLAHNRAWAVGGTSIKDPKGREISLSTSPLILSWDIDGVP